MAADDLFERGLETRRKALGAEYVDGGIANSSDFMMGFQRTVTEVAWGLAWSRDGLEFKTRFMITMAILVAQSRWEELTIYARGALRAGVTVDELTELLIHAMAYCGTPAGRQGFLAVDKAVQENSASSS